MVIISPFEAQNLVGEIKTHKRVMLHLYAPRLLLGLRRSMGTVFTRPRPCQTAGPCLSEYMAVCDMLGMDWRGRGGDGDEKQQDGDGVEANV
ncbi:hypothetical protein ACKVWH_011517 [Pyricularia oryzae]